MKFFKYSVLALMGMTVSLTACSDDDDYAVGAQSPGAYFSEGMPETYKVAEGSSSFDVVVSRTGVDAPVTYTLASTDPSGLFTIPTSVTFEANALTAAVTITYTDTQLEWDTKYPLSLTLTDGATTYGNNKYSFNVIKANPIISKDLGVGQFTYACIWSGTYDDGTTLQYNPAKPNDQTYILSEWGGGNSDFAIHVPDAEARDSYGDCPAYVHPQNTLYVHSKYGPVWVADLYCYMLEYFNDPATAAKYEGASYLTPERGLFTMNNVYYIPEYEEGDSYIGNLEEEYYQLAGYPDLSISASYVGTIINPDRSFEAIAHVVPGKDVAAIKAAMVPGGDESAALKAVLLGQGVQELDAKEQDVRFGMTEGGQYTIAFVSFDSEGEAAEVAAVKFNVELEQTTINVGYADYTDPYVIPAYTSNGQPIDNRQYTFSVPLLQSKKDANVYYLDSPYTNAAFLLAGNNLNKDEVRKIGFDVTVPASVIIEPQGSGYFNANWGGELIIGNLAGYLYSENPGITPAQVYTAMQSNPKVEADDYTTLEDGIITISSAWIGAPKIGDGTFGYSWNNPQVGFIYMPESSDEAKARVKSLNVVRPKLAGMLRVTKAAKKVKKDTMTMAPVVVKNSKNMKSSIVRR